MWNAKARKPKMQKSLGNLCTYKKGRYQSCLKDIERLFTQLFLFAVSTEPSAPRDALWNSSYALLNTSINLGLFENVSEFRSLKVNWLLNKSTTFIDFRGLSFVLRCERATLAKQSKMSLAYQTFSVFWWCQFGTIEVFYVRTFQRTTIKPDLQIMINYRPHFTTSIMTCGFSQASRFGYANASTIKTSAQTLEKDRAPRRIGS